MKCIPLVFLNRLVGLTAVICLAASCNRQSVNHPSWEQHTMGTLCHITLSGPVSENRLSQLRETIDAELEKVNRLMSTWQADTEISQFNSYKSTQPFSVSPAFADVVRRALEVAESTGGALDPTVKPLVDHWGFGPDAGTEPLEQIMPAVGWQKVQVENNTLVKTHSDVQLDLSAIAKGYGVDAVADVIRAAGIDNFLVEIGGEIVAEGMNPKQRAWIVGVEAPQADAAFGTQILRTVELSGKALATSGDYRNFRERADGTRYSHLIDPVTGQPAGTDVASVCVLADSCMDADAAATALFVMGSKKGFQWLSELREKEGDDGAGLDALFILHTTNQRFTIRATDGFPKE